MTVGDRYAAIRHRVGEAARAAGRAAADVTVVGVCKRQPADRIRAAYDSGLRHFGENTAQGLERSVDALVGCDDVRWHFVGALQRNKINTVLPHRPTIHSIDRPKLARALAQRAAETVDVLVQVNIGRETQKGGVEPERALELCAEVAGLDGLRLRGLMAIPPRADARSHFVPMADLHGRLRKQPYGAAADVLSMGMSADFEDAIAAGATLIRVGTALFGPRDS